MSQGDQGIVRRVRGRAVMACPSCSIGTVRVTNELEAKPGHQYAVCDNATCGWDIRRPNHGADTLGGKLR